MKESPYVEIFFDSISEICKKYRKGNFIVKMKSNLLYEICVNPKLELEIKDLSNPSRGSSAFQTDICIFEIRDKIEIPRVVLEFKTNYTTHDILTYSAKAGKHKQIYPYLRYGLIATSMDNISGRFFTHNEHLDFLITTKKYNDSEMEKISSKLFESEIRKSLLLEEIYFGDKKFDYFTTDFVFKNIL
jgi:hypothetical protein